MGRLQREKRKERRRLRHERNLAKDIQHKRDSWESGKLIKENRNQEPYSQEYTVSLCERLVNYILQEKLRAGQSRDPYREYIKGFQKYKTHVQDLILNWNPNVEINSGYTFLKTLIELYWDEVLGKQNYQPFWELEP